MKKIAISRQSIQLFLRNFITWPFFTKCFVGGVTFVLVILIIRSLSIPMWYDEAWRAYDISSTSSIIAPKFDAPIPLGTFLLTKAASFVSNTELAHRLYTYICALLLPSLLYLYTKKIKGRTFALLCVGILPFTAYILEFVPQNKPYIADVFFTLLFLWILELFIERKVRLRVFIGVSILSLFFTSATFFLFIGAGIILAVKFLRKQISFKSVLVWALTVGIIAVVYYLVFLKSQVNSGLIGYWSEYSWKGKSKIEIFEFVKLNMISMFKDGLLPSKSQYGFLTVLEPVISFGYFVSFLLGMLLLMYRRKFTLPIVIGSYLAVSFIFSYLYIWPFGNNRVNSFAFILIGITALYFIHELIIQAVKTRNLFVFLLVVMIGLDFFPSLLIAQRIYLPRPVIYLDGMRDVTDIVYKNSNQDELVINYHFMNKKPFLYYYNHYDRGYKNTHAAQNFMFDEIAQPLKSDKEFYKELSAKYKVVWVLWGAGIGKDMSLEASESYNTAENAAIDYVGYAKLVRKE